MAMLFPILCPELLILAIISTVSGKEVFYQTIQGKCNDLHEVRNFPDQKIATGEWYEQYQSFGQAEDRCSMSHLIERGTTNFIDFLLYDPLADQYELFPDDMMYHPEKSGVYTNSLGAVGHVLTSDPEHGMMFMQCLEINGQTKVMAYFATRERQITDQEQTLYDAVAAKLKAKNLLPQMYIVPQKNCPPEYKIKYEKKA